MNEQPKILAFAGSLREGSYNKKLVKVAIKGAEAAGAKVTFIDLKDFPMPILNQDEEDSQGLPENAKKLKKIMLEHDGFLISSPEYNSSISGVLKNFIDWTSRQETKDEPPLSCFVGKVAALLSASPGQLGGIRGLVHLRSILGNINVLLLPQQKCISQAHEAFNEDGTLKNNKQQKEVEKIGADLARLITSIKSRT
ncbi:FMN-dependent NADPH-azoreductase [Candidatus Rubidus massiliensis]|nr:MAG: NADPH-dependent FMN reductase [Chlamydia sp. 32-24]CDZ81778.1 FMN-dependent NADPH-azoreductase [Candidatus Rubidus massiliensis]